MQDLVSLSAILWIAVPIFLAIIILPSIRIISENELGLVIKRFGKPLTGGNIIAMNGEAGYQADMLMPGWRFKFWLTHKVQKHPWVQVPAGQIGLVIAQVGNSVPIGAKSARYKPIFGDFRDLRTFISNEGEKGVQRPVLPPGTAAPIHPVGFLVITKGHVYGVPIDSDLGDKKGNLTCQTFNLQPSQLDVTIVAPTTNERGAATIDMVGIVTTLEGEPLPEGDIASRLGGFDDLEKMEKDEMSEEEAAKFATQQAEAMDKMAEAANLAAEAATLRKKARDAIRAARNKEEDESLKNAAEEARKEADAKKAEADLASEAANKALSNMALEISKKDNRLIDRLLASKNNQHNNYQDFQKFMDSGGRIGLQHDPLLYGAYLLNPFLVKVDFVPMLVVEQGEVAVIKAYVGLVTKDTSGANFKFGSLVRPGHRGIWQEPLRTGKYALNPRIYQAEIVPTQILTLNWAEAVSKAHDLDKNLSQIEAKSREGFVFNIDLQVQIHVPDTRSPRVISRVGSMLNLVDEVLQAAVGNHFRDTLQSMPAVDFIETRQEVQEDALYHIRQKLSDYEVETPGVYIQDVLLPEELVTVLKAREIANQKIRTFEMERLSEEARVKKEKQAGIANKQADLSASEVDIVIKKNEADARSEQARGEATYTRETGRAEGEKLEAIGKGQAAGYSEQVKALGQDNTAMVNVTHALAQGKQPFVPQIQVSGNDSGNGAANGIMAAVLGTLMKQGKVGSDMPPNEPTTIERSSTAPDVPSAPTVRSTNDDSEDSSH